MIMIICDPENILPHMLSATESSLKLCFGLCAIYAVWLGLIQILIDCRAHVFFAKLLRPVTKKLFGNVDDETTMLISMNLASNMLGIGGASTALGIKAMTRMQDGSKKATFGMIMFMVINATSIQLFPSTVISMRASMGSSNPSDIFFPSLIATCVSTVVGILLVVVCNKIFNKKVQHE